MADEYTPDPTHTPATITVPDDGDPLGASSVATPVEQLADLVANARLNAAKTNVDNHFSASQSITGSLGVSGSAVVAGQAQLNGGHAQVVPHPFGATRIQVETIGNALNASSFFRSYVLPTGALEFTVNAFWNQTNGNYDRDDTSASTIRYTFSPGGLLIQSYQGASATVDDSLWVSSLDLSMPSIGAHATGRVLGLTADGSATFSTTPLATYLASAFPAMFATAFGIAVNPASTLIDLSAGLTPGYVYDPTKGRKPQVFKDAFGVVHLEGCVSGTSSSPVGQKFFTLPAGYRPAAKMRFLATIADAGGTYPAVADVVTVDTNGDCVGTSATLGFTSADGLSLEGICFRADA